MPTYEYRCDECSRLFEMFLGINDNSPVLCPACGAAARRLPGKGAGVIIRGGSGSGKSLPCGNDKTCCGRESRCDRPPCSD